MKSPDERKMEELFENFPILEMLQHDWRWRENKRWRKPKISVHVQLADPEAMHLQAKNIDYLDRGYISKNENGDRGTRLQYLVAVNNADMEIATLFWERGEHEKMSKDIFLTVPPSQVSYLVWVTAIEWYKPASEEREKETNGILFDTQKTGVELEVIVFRKPRDISFETLIATADQQKKEREEAYKFPPKEMPDLPGIHQALASGCRLHAFSSGGGLRVVRLELNGTLKAYGEDPHIEEALKILEEDFLAGGRPYKEVYGKSRPHYLTGATLATSNLDAWVRRGNTFDCWSEKEETVFALKGCVQTEIPKEVTERLAEKIEEGEAVLWTNRGFTYASCHDHFPNGDPCTKTFVVNSPPGKKGSDPWMYKITKTGRGKNFWEAMAQAFQAPEIENHE